MNTLAELKRHLRPGVELTCTFNSGGQRLIGKKRKILKSQTNGIYIEVIPGNNRGSWLGLPKASLIEVGDRGFKIFSIGKRELTPKEKEVLDDQPRDQKQEEIDALSDGNVMYWRRLEYFKKAGFEYLFAGHIRKNGGKGLDYNDMKVRDPAIKGELLLGYELAEQKGV